MRVTFSEEEAIGIGYYVASNPNPSDASLLVGSIDTTELEGDRVEVAGKAFRLDGEFNVANRGMMELVEVFKADPHILTTLLGLAQEQLIKMDRFGSIYADEVIIGHTNEGDFTDFKADERSEALKDRLIEIRVPYNVRVRDEVGIYRKMVEKSALEGVHISALTLPAMSVFAVLSRLEPPTKQGMPVLDKLRLYDGQKVLHSSPDDVVEMRRHHVNEGMSGISPRYVMNRLSAVASTPDIQCISPLMAVDSLWQGLRENVSLEDEDPLKHIEIVRDTVQEYSNRAIMDVQRAFKEGFEESASDLLNEYLDLMDTHFAGGGTTERDMREMEKHAGIADNRRADFRREIHQIFSSLKRRGISFDYNTEPRLKAGIESRLFPSRREIERTLAQPRFARQPIEWRRERTTVYNRLINTYDYCPRCADNLIEYVVHALKRRAVVRFPKNEGIEWLWDLNPEPPSQQDESS